MCNMQCAVQFSACWMNSPSLHPTPNPNLFFFLKAIDS